MIGSLRKKIDALQREHDHALLRVKEEKTALREALSRLHHAQEAQALLQSVARDVQQQAHTRVAEVVTRCLRAVGFDYDFRIEFNKKRGRTEAQLQFVRGGLVIDDPTASSGGGAVDVAAFALRLSALMLSRPPRRKLLCLDEPCKNVNGEEFQSRVGALILKLAEELGVQFVIVSDDSWLRVGKVIDLGD